MGRRFGSGAAILAVGLWASVGVAQTTANPGGEIDVIAWSYATISQSGAVVAMETISGARGGGATFDLGPGHWIITTECHGAGACAPHAFTGLRLNGRQIDLPGPTEELELQLGEARGRIRVSADVSTLRSDPINGIGGVGGGRYTFVPTTRRVIISDGVPGNAEALRPTDDNARGDGGGGDGGAGGGGAGSP